MANDTESQGRAAHAIEAEGRADVARLAAWHGLAIDLAVIAASTVLAVTGVLPAAAVIGVLGGLAGARAARAATGGTSRTGGGAAVLPLALALVHRVRL